MFLGGNAYNDGTSLKGMNFFNVLFSFIIYMILFLLNLNCTDGKSGINNTTILYILIACCLLLISCIGIGIAVLCCKQNKPLRNRSKKG